MSQKPAVTAVSDGLEEVSARPAGRCHQTVPVKRTPGSCGFSYPRISTYFRRGKAVSSPCEGQGG